MEIKKLGWGTDKDGHKYAYVGDLLISYIFKPWIFKKYSVQIGLSINFEVNELDYINKTFKTEEDAMQYVEDWWNDIVNKITRRLKK